MANKKTFAAKAAKTERKSAEASASTTSARSTVSGPARKDRGSPGDELTAKMDGSQALAKAIPFNANKTREYGKASVKPEPGTTVPAPDPRATGSTLTESSASAKAGAGKPKLGVNPGNLPLDRSRVDSTDRVLTTNLGVPVADNQHSLKAGLRCSKTSSCVRRSRTSITSVSQSASCTRAALLPMATSNATSR